MDSLPRLALSLAACLVLSLAGGAEALASAPSSAASAFSMTISPTRLDIGRSESGATQHVEVFNGGTSPLAVTVAKKNFTGALNGAMNFQPSASYSAAAWVTLSPASFVVAPGATQVVSASIAIPAHPEPGDHQVALVFFVPAGRSGANIKINRGIGMPVYITAPGPISNAASISHLSAPSFATGGPVTITAQVKDTGTVHRDFRGAAALKLDAAGSASAFPDFTVTRDSSRAIATTWHPPLFCICHVKVSIPGTAGSSTVRVIVVPLALIGTVLGAIALLVGGAAVTRRRYRSSVLKAAARMGRAADGAGS